MNKTTRAIHTTDGEAPDLGGKYADAKNAVTDLASEARKSALVYAADLKKNSTKWLKEKSSKIQSKASEANLTVISYVRKNPYKSMAIVAAAGLVLGYALHRSRRRD
jgi:ElaB/YqjD/DUF883 family membrane-anchored ribosome-binding protein